MAYAKWGDPASWNTGTVPNATDADVSVTANGIASGYNLGIEAGQAYTVHTLNLSAAQLFVPGSLTAAGVSLQGGASVFLLGTLTAGALSIGGSTPAPTYAGPSSVTGAGIVSVGGPLLNQGTISTSNQAGGNDLAVTAGALTNYGSLLADTHKLTVTVAAGGFSNLSGTTLTGGSYTAVNGGTLDLNVGGTIVTDAATIALGSVYDGATAPDTIASYDSVAGAYVPLQASLQTIASGGSLSLNTGGTFASTLTTVASGGALTLYDGQTVSTPGPLAVGGTVTLVADATVTPTLATGELDIASGGAVAGVGTISGPIVDKGSITSGVGRGSGSTSGAAGTLLLQGVISGSGSLTVGKATALYQNGTIFRVGYGASTLELAGSTALPVTFADALGILKIDNPADFTGTITPFATEVVPVGSSSYPSDDQVILAGISASTVTGYSYAGNTAGGVLTIHEGAVAQTLSFAGNLTTASFALSAGSQGSTAEPGRHGRAHIQRDHRPAGSVRHRGQVDHQHDHPDSGRDGAGWHGRVGDRQRRGPRRSGCRRGVLCRSFAVHDVLNRAGHAAGPGCAASRPQGHGQQQPGFRHDRRAAEPVRPTRARVRRDHRRLQLIRSRDRAGPGIQLPVHQRNGSRAAHQWHAVGWSRHRTGRDPTSVRGPGRPRRDASGAVRLLDCIGRRCERHEPRQRAAGHRRVHRGPWHARHRHGRAVHHQPL